METLDPNTFLGMRVFYALLFTLSFLFQDIAS
jgi:hypothetical protein